MTNNIIVFEGADEVLVVAAGNVNSFIAEWFLDAQRNLNDYDVYLADASEGFAITSGIKFTDYKGDDFDVEELMPNELRKALIDAELLIDES